MITVTIYLSDGEDAIIAGLGHRAGSDTYNKGLSRSRRHYYLNKKGYDEILP